ncbi:unnamed protein product [Closterium sp. NIES-53]
MTPRVRQAAEAVLGGMQPPALLTNAVSGTENVGAGASTSTSLTPSVPLTKLLGGGGLTTALLQLALTTTGATPLCNSATSSTTASAASATTAAATAAAASTAAADTSTSTTTPTTTPTPSTASTTTSTAPATPTSAPAPLAPASIEAAALGASESALLGTAPAEALHTFTLDSSALRCFFRDSTTLTPLSTPIPVRLADPSEGPILARSSIVLPCPAVPFGSLSYLHLPSFSTNLVSTAALQDAMVTTTTPGGQCVSICTCTWTGRHLATFTRRPGSSLYTLATEPPLVVASVKVFASGKVAASCSCRLLSHQTLLWHHRLGHPSLPRLHDMHSCLLVSGLPRSLPPLPPSPTPPCLPCDEGGQCATPHSSFPPMTAPLQTLHLDVWGPARVSGQGLPHWLSHGGTGAGGAGAGGAGARAGGAVDHGAGGTGGGGAVSGGAGTGGTVRPRPYFLHPLLQPASPLPAPSPYPEQTGGLTERCEPASRPASPVRTGRRVPCLHPPSVPSTHAVALRPSSVTLRVPLPPPLESPLLAVHDPESDSARAANPTVSRLLATVVIDPSFESTAASALVAELNDFPSTCRLDYATALVAESESASPPSVRGECGPGKDVREDKLEGFKCLAASVSRFASMLLAPEEDPDAADILTLRSYAEAITTPYSS